MRGVKKEKKITKKLLKKLEKRERNKKDKEWRLAVKKRDNSQCIVCKRTDYINCHHIIPRENKTFRWNIDNGISLCPSHHKFSIELSPHKNPVAFFSWFQKNRKEQWEKISKLFD